MASEDVSVPCPSAHRLPTVSASQALQTLHTRGARTISTGISQLDKLLASPSLPGHPVAGGYTRGKVTEVFGPSGVGKTAFGIQAAVNALREGQHVVWVDAACPPLVPYRFSHVLSALSDSPSELSPDELRNHFRHVAATTLAHLLALFVHPPASFPQPKTSLIVIDSLSTLIENAYPRNMEIKNKTDQLKWAAGRRFAVINELIKTFTKFAALHDIALLITCPTISRIRGGNRSLLVPAMSGIEWENGISTRLVLFRDWIPRQGKPNNTRDADKLINVRFAGLVKANGVALTDEGGVGSVVPFTIDNTGLCDISIAADDISAPLAQSRPPKRSFAEIEENEDETPKSDELYGWVEDDEVATEGLLIDETQDTNDVETVEARPEHTTEIALRQSSKMARFTTI
ncbi:P-loop containing nucleoside triphosphate hydrolase protein [Dothidotthia symphoricarpi CBS 119687]|uniref:P-loop containing nucleoside triphosphate hydrolase protein n=1 Tax=Dothidotthia symphoricarpi CBS 119687 TaxID=1392245 RepID=A0A6A6A1Y7_9PLEO|nr:P-loop containing nucleoside triphosphate hydrolase protein [Dothidotthia symphoricarpi CBS 119687]KAF2124957.1 P-loop containing nucleoside triphosphate hydrolase protein [Dothidotthia symphoricarpi CBS 119687]